ncbi:MAG: hypothetical protein AVDCRST_MAG56-4224 [uncultured Cytophagales bacterium]|uniref:Uncharacterized protein n=1 Tax=uncultured Cytophagales bacterium TaxID=158755 RepID=A0A6J4JRX3_9SPHI|nr:MAG: hypothetical protein AVDCRST_MAG56-4224 [uncultured Cytophagales bacterium]
MYVEKNKELVDIISSPPVSVLVLHHTNHCKLLHNSSSLPAAARS